MLGFEMMMKNMLEGMGINVEQLTKEGVEAYHQFRAMAESMLRTQADIVTLLKANYALQKNNTDKLDAILAHFEIEFSPATITEELTDGRNGSEQLGIEYKPN